MRLYRQNIFVVGFNLATILLWGAFVYAFISKQGITIPWSVVDLYLLVLTFYAADKEIRRWRHAHRSTQHRGEYITFGWVVTIAFMLGVEVAGGGSAGYAVPSHMGLAVGGIVILYFITQYLKAEYEQRGFSTAVTPKRRSRRRNGG